VRECNKRLAVQRTLQALLAKLRESDVDLMAPETIRQSLEFVLERVSAEEKSPAR
jgi:hypothetical protein